MTALPNAQDIIDSLRPQQSAPGPFVGPPSPGPAVPFNDNMMLDASKSSPVSERIGIGMFKRDDDKQKYLEQNYPPTEMPGGQRIGNVAKTGLGDWVVRAGPHEPWRPVSSISGSALKRIPESVGQALPAIGAMVGGVVGTPIFGGGIGGAAGEAVRQVSADALIGGSTAPTSQRLLELGGAGGENSLLGAAGVAGQGVMDSMRAGHGLAANSMEEIYNKSGLPDARSILQRARDFINGRSEAPQMSHLASQGMELEKNTPTGMTLDQQLESPTLKNAMGVARRGARAGDIVQAADYNRQRMFTARLDSFANSLAGGDSKRGAGEAMASAYDNELNRLIRQRSDARVYDEPFSIMPRGEAGAEAFEPTAAKDAAIGLRSELNAPAGTSTMGGGDKATLANRLTDYIKSLPKTMNPKEMQQSIIQWKDELSGSGNITADLPSGQREWVASTILDGLRADFARAEATGKIPVGSQAALAKADAAYAKLSEPITAAREMAMSKLLGDSRAAPEAIVDKMDSLHPSQLEDFMAFLRKADPASADEATKAFIMKKVVDPTKEMVKGGEVFAKPGALRFLDKPSNLAPIMAVLPKESRGALQDILEIARRTRDLPLSGSPTGPYVSAEKDLEQAMAGPMSKYAGMGAVLGGLTGLGGAAAADGGDKQTLGAAGLASMAVGAASGAGLRAVSDWVTRRNTRQLVNIITNSEGIGLIRQLAKPGTKAGFAVRALGQLAEIAGPDLPGKAAARMTEDQP